MQDRGKMDLGGRDTIARRPMEGLLRQAADFQQ